MRSPSNAPMITPPLSAHVWMCELKSCSCAPEAVSASAVLRLLLLVTA
jgi:hypothetical protein